MLKHPKQAIPRCRPAAGGLLHPAFSATNVNNLLQTLTKPFLNWSSKAERHQITVPTVPLFVHERHSTKAILEGRFAPKERIRVDARNGVFSFDKAKAAQKKAA